MLLQGVPAPERRERVRRLFAEIGLEGLEDRMPPKLSGGQQQRVAVARAVLAEPALVLADEPTANLDSTMAEALLDVMEKLNREKGTTFVFSTHDPRVMERAGRLIRLVEGYRGWVCLLLALEQGSRRLPVIVRFSVPPGRAP